MWKPFNQPDEWQEDVQLARVVKDRGTAMEQFIYRALRSEKHVLLTLKGGKVYVGRIVSAFEPSPQSEPTILLFPTLSGYRESNSHLVCWTINYDTTYADIKRDYDDAARRTIMREFRIVIPIAEIIVMTVFSYEVHEKYFADKKLSEEFTPHL